MGFRDICIANYEFLGTKKIEKDCCSRRYCRIFDAHGAHVNVTRNPDCRAQRYSPTRNRFMCSGTCNRTSCRAPPQPPPTFLPTIRTRMLRRRSPLPALLLPIQHQLRPQQSNLPLQLHQNQHRG